MSGPRHRRQIVPDTWVTPFPFPGEAWMPWKECSMMDERLRFVARLLDGEAMSEVCRAFGISRKTGYKIFERYEGGCQLFCVSRSRETLYVVEGITDYGTSDQGRTH